jgi:hypothetical protein
MPAFPSIAHVAVTVSGLDGCAALIGYAWVSPPTDKGFTAERGASRRTA